MVCFYFGNCPGRIQRFHLFQSGTRPSGDSVGDIQGKFARLLGYFRSAEWQNSNLGLSDIPNNTPPLQQGDMLAIVDTNGQIVQIVGNQTKRQTSQAISFQRPANNEVSMFMNKTISITDSTGKTSDADYLFIVSFIFRGDTPVGALIIGSPTNLSC